MKILKSLNIIGQPSKLENKNRVPLNDGVTTTPKSLQILQVQYAKKVQSTS